MSLSLSSDVVQVLDWLAKDTDVNRSQVVETLLRFGLRDELNSLRQRGRVLISGFADLAFSDYTDEDDPLDALVRNVVP